MKKLFLLCSIFLLFNLSFATKITEKEAYTVALTFINSKIETSPTLQLAEVRTSGNDIIFYRFQIEKKGFIIVSGSNKTSPILAYSLEYNFNENPALNYLFDRFEKEIVAIEKRNIPAPSWIANQWESLLTNSFTRPSNEFVKPLLTTTWNQNRFYNTYCPWDVYAGPYYDYRVPNGCVALSMAMIMNYYQYPISGTGGVSYTPPGYPRQTVQFGQFTYNYDAMYDEPYDYANEISKLAYHCGVAVKMHYDHTGSGATEVEARQQFINIFKYYAGASLQGPGMYDNWGAELKGQLDKRYPLFYTAATSTSGHAFVIDGYDEDTLFHVNWGWGGDANGYFHITNLDPFGTGDGFNNYENAIFNLYPRENFPAHCSGHKRMTASFGTITNGSANQFYAANSDCSWMVAVKDATDYIFEFSRLDTEENEDFITIYNGPTISSGIARRFSGNVIPEAISVSDVDSVLVTFTSNTTTEKRGFVLRYRTVLNSPCCSGTVTKTSPEGTISDNSGDEEYSNEATCTWLIQPNYAGSISCTFLDFDLKSGDFVDIYNNTYNPAILVDRFDRLNVPQGWKTYNFSKMKVVFVGDNWQNGNGFTLKWSAELVGINDICNIKEFNVYPNPATEFIWVEFTADQFTPVTCSISDCTGKILLSKTLVPKEKNKEKIELPKLAKGIYFIKLQNVSGNIIRKLILN